MFESAVRSGLARGYTITIIVYRCPVTRSSHFFNRVDIPPVPRAPPFFGQIATTVRQFPQRAPFFIAFSQKHVQIPCNAVVGVVEWSYISFMLRLFSGSRTAFCQSAGQAARRGAASFPWGGLYHHTRGPGQPAALRRLAAGREEEEHKK